VVALSRDSHDLRVVWDCAIIVVVSGEVRGFPNGYPGIVGERIVAMRKALEWFDGLAPNHMVWAVCTYGMAITMIVMFIHIVKL